MTNIDGDIKKYIVDWALFVINHSGAKDSQVMMNSAMS